MVSRTKMLLAFKVLGMPKIVDIEATALKSLGKARVLQAIEKAPQSGVLVVSGTSSPLLQAFFMQGRTVAAINYYDLFTAKFTEEQLELPPPRRGQVTLVYAVGKEPVKSYEYSAKLLDGIIARYSADGLVIIETALAPAAFNMNYAQDFPNTLSIPLKKEEVWVEGGKL